MTLDQHLIAASALAALGVWLLLPPAGDARRALGLVVAASGLGWLMARMPGMGSWTVDTAFWSLAAATSAAAVATVTSRNPVYSALWFALSLLGTAGIFALLGAQFLAAATVVVYAGAIVVTFLFVLMLAQPDGTAFYDRVGWGRGVSLAASLAAGTIVAVLAMMLAGAEGDLAAAGKTTEAIAAGVGNEEHVARLGASLLTRHLAGVELAGTLLLVALVGAVAITSQGRPGRFGRRSSAKERRHG